MSLVRLVTLTSGAALAFVMTTAPAAHAQESQGAASAQVLYDEGRQLVAGGRIAEGCAKLAESNRVDPAVGTRFYLADCYERIGRTASAWAIFLEVATASKVRGHAAREALAKERAAALEPRLSKLTIMVDAFTDDEQVRRDDVVLGRASWGTAMPVDPGTHVVTATAEGRRPWTGKIDVPAEGASLLLRVPALAMAPVELASAQPESTRSSPALRNVGLGLGALGLAAVALGVVTGLDAMSKNDDSKALCDGNACSSEGKALRDDAISSAWISNVSLGAGALAIIAGTTLFIVGTSRHDAAPSRVGVHVGPAGAGLSGVF